MLIPLAFGLISAVALSAFILISQAIYELVHKIVAKREAALREEEEFVKKNTPYKGAIIASRLPSPYESMHNSGENIGEGSENSKN